MAHPPLPLHQRTFGETLRRDRWWLQPLVVFVILTSFLAYATWAAFQGRHYTYGPYLSPFYSPELFGESSHSWFGREPRWWPGFVPFSPALLILPFPAFFRVTCYYYRGAYYKAFWGDPPACAVGEPRTSYWGERTLPLVLQNVHRFFLYIALCFLVVLAHDVWRALWFLDPATGRQSFGVGVGTIVLAVNLILLGSYTLGCHSLRHVVGGYLDRLSRHPIRKVAYDCSSCLNRRHMRWAWLSLFGVALTDLYVRLCSMGVWTDWRLL
ncbi:MAG: hypothetical protein NVS1B4_07400 [Gemmatimonadaceae bacterium]